MLTPNEQFLRALSMISGALLAQEVGVTPQYVSKVKRQALENGQDFRVQAEWAPVLERLTQGRVTRAELRPDLYGGVWPAEISARPEAA